MHEKGGSLCLGAVIQTPCVYRLIADMNPYTFMLFCECLLKTVALVLFQATKQQEHTTAIQPL